MIMATTEGYLVNVVIWLVICDLVALQRSDGALEISQAAATIVAGIGRSTGVRS